MAFIYSWSSYHIAVITQSIPETTIFVSAKSISTLKTRAATENELKVMKIQYKHPTKIDKFHRTTKITYTKNYLILGDKLAIL